MGDFRRDIRYLLNRRDALRFSAFGAFLAVEALLEVAALASVPLFVSLLLQSGQPVTANTFGEWLAEALAGCVQGTVLWGAGILVVLLNLVRTIWSMLGLRLQYRIQANRRIELSSRLLRSYLLASSSFHTSRNSSQLLNSVVVECDNVIQGVLTPVFEFVRGGANAFFVTVMLLIYAPGMTAAAFGLMAIFCTGTLLYRNHRLKALAHQEQLGREEALKQGAEALDSRVEATIHGCRRGFLQRFHKAVHKVSHAQGGNMLLQRETWPILEFLSLLALMSVLLVSLMLEDGDLSRVAPQISLLAMALVRLRSNAVNILQNILQFKRYKPSLHAVCQDIRELENGAPDTAERIISEDAEHPWDFQKAISIRNATFAYPENSRPALADVSLDIPKGQSIAIVGPTGCGKSTLVRLLLGLEKPQKGDVMVDERPLDEILHNWQHAVGYVPQKPFLLDGTLAENATLEFEGQAVDQTALARSLTKAQLSDFVETLPLKANTPIGENAGRLSGGQAQRVALARAFYRQANVLILDEATSALDQNTASAIAETLVAHKGTETIIAITHHLSSLSAFDRVVFMKDGRILDTGTYEELIRNCSEFQNFTANK